MSLSDALKRLEEWTLRQPAVVDSEERAVLIGIIGEVACSARDVDVLECKVRGLEAAMTLLILGQPVSLTWYEKLQRDCLDRRRRT